MTLECQSEHLGASFKSKPKSLREFTEDIATECDSYEISHILIHTKDTFCLAKVELRSKRSFIGYELPMTIYFASVFDTNIKALLKIDKYISYILFWEGKLSLWSLSLACHVESKSLF